ncbi:MAG: hemolysin family protein [Bryobacteraceae bacterium]|nr:hemolysin family protein [Bryobacteraceae bacterium]
MTLLVLALLLLALLTLISCVQLLYLDSLRLRTRDLESLDYFKEELQDALGYDTEAGALLFSLIKHTLLVFTGAAFSAATLIAAPGWPSALEGFAIGWLVMLCAAYLFPQILYRRSTGRWLRPLVPLLRFIALLFKPLKFLLGFLQSLYELSQPAPPEDMPADPAGEIEALITAGEEEGIIEKEDSRLIQSVVAFGDKRVREVMTPRPAIVAIPADRNLDDLRALARSEQYSRIPVYSESIDRILGFIHVRDLWELSDEERMRKTLLELMRPLQPVPETKLAADLLREMQAGGIHMVYVVDEYGNTAGIATFEDLVEEVFGEIRDEHEPAHDIQRHDDGSVTVSGSFDLDHLHELFDFRPATDIEATTIGGLVTEWMGAVPAAGAAVERDGLRLEVLAADDLRVKRVRIARVEQEGEPAEA